MPDEQEAADALDAAVEQLNAGEESTSDQEEVSEAAEASEQEEAATESTESEEEPQEQVLKPSLQKILDKYGGDQDKLADALWEHWKSGSEMHKRLEALEADVRQAKQAPPPPPEPDPEVTEIQEELQTLDAEVRENITAMQQLGKSLDDTTRRIYEIRGEIKNADDYEKQRLHQEEAQLRQELKSTLKEHKDAERENKRIMKDQRSLAKRLRAAQQTSAERNADSARQRVAEAEFRADTVRTFNQTIDTAVRTYDFPDPAHMQQSVSDSVTGYLSRLPKDAPAVDIEALTNKFVESYAKAMKVSKDKQFAAVSKNKGAQLSRGRAVLPSKPLPPPAGKTWEEKAQNARAEAARLLGG